MSNLSNESQKSQNHTYMSQKFKRTLKYSRLAIPFLFFGLAVFFSNCNKGHVEILDILDTVENCSVPYVVYFYPKADIGNGDVSYRWDFGDGEFSDERTPVHVYNKTGLFTVTLKVRNKEKEDVKSKKIDLQAASLPIQPEFEYAYFGSGKFAPAKFSFLNYSQHATSFEWDFGDGYSSELESPTHEFAFSGTYNVTLNAICNGDTAKLSESFTILPAPNDFYIADIRVWLPSQFLGTSIICDVSYNGWVIETSPVAHDISGYPVVLPINEYVPHIDFGPYDNIKFEVYDINVANSAPIYTFAVSMLDIQNDYYPYMLIFDDGNDYAAEVDINYEIDKKKK